MQAFKTIIFVTLIFSSTVCFAQDPYADFKKRSKGHLERLKKSNQKNEYQPELDPKKIAEIEQSGAETEKRITIEDQPVNDFSVEQPDLSELNEAYQKQLDAQKQTFIESLGTPESRAQKNRLQTNIGGSQGEYVYVLISKSIPRKTLKSYVLELSRMKNDQISLNLRGLTDPKIYLTMNWFLEILSKDSSCKGLQCPTYQVGLHINPNPFRDLKINRVPAIVYVKSKQEGKTYDSKDYVVFYGATSIKYGLEKIQRKVDSPLINQLLAKD